MSSFQAPLRKIRLDEREAASIVAGLHSTIIDASLAAAAGVAPTSAPPAAGAKKRGVRDRDDDRDGGGTNHNNNEGDAKRSRKKSAIAPPVKPKARKDPPMDATGLVFAQPELKPAPYFYYSDHSLEEDDDPLMPITAVGSVPTFPASEFPFSVYCVIFIRLIFRTWLVGTYIFVNPAPSHFTFAC